jgi:hypothetical protein
MAYITPVELNELILELTQYLEATTVTVAFAQKNTGDYNTYRE